ncbi:MAG: hypothetical protein ACLR5Y_05770 [Haemophilus parainfluenzae]
MRAEYKDPAVQIIDKQKRVHMAHMDIHFQILKWCGGITYGDFENSELKAFYALYPEKFNNRQTALPSAVG